MASRTRLLTLPATAAIMAVCEVTSRMVRSLRHADGPSRRFTTGEEERGGEGGAEKKVWQRPSSFFRKRGSHFEQSITHGSEDGSELGGHFGSSLLGTHPLRARLALRRTSASFDCNVERDLRSCDMMGAKTRCDTRCNLKVVLRWIRMSTENRIRIVTSMSENI